MDISGYIIHFIGELIKLTGDKEPVKQLVVSKDLFQRITLESRLDVIDDTNHISMVDLCGIKITCCDEKERGLGSER